MAREKYSYDFKLKVVKYYLKNSGARRSVGTYFSISSEHVRKWVDIYNSFGKVGLKDDIRRTQYTFELKKQTALSIVEDGLSIRDAMKHSNLKSSALVANWLRHYREHGIDGLKPKPKGRSKQMPKPKILRAKPSQEDRDKTQEQLLDEIAYLRAEVAYLKKRRAFFQKQKSRKKQDSNDCKICI
jgi:transposase